MGSIIKTKEGAWSAQVRRKGKYASGTFRLKSLANEWTTETERLIDLSCDPYKRIDRNPKTVADLIDIHISDLQEIGTPLRRSKRAAMEALKRDLGTTRIDRLDRTVIIKYSKLRARQGAGPVTLSVDVSYLRTVLTHAAAIHWLTLFPRHSGAPQMQIV